MTTIERKSSVAPMGGGTNAPPAGAASSTMLAPPLDGPVPTDDMQTALAVLMIQSSKEQRVMSDAQRALAAKSQEEANARKIEKLREIANATFAQGLVEGFIQVGAASLQAKSALLGYDSARADIVSKQRTDIGAMAAARGWTDYAAKLGRDSKLLEAGSRGVSAAGTMLIGSLKSGIEHGRADAAEIDREIDRARSAVDGASSESKRAQDDIRETMGFIRQYLATKAQLNQASIVRG